LLFIPQQNTSLPDALPDESRRLNSLQAAISITLLWANKSAVCPIYGFEQVGKNMMGLSYGSFDNRFWENKNSNTFSSAYSQKCVYALALLYSHNFEGNKYYQNPEILEYATTSMLFWTLFLFALESFGRSSVKTFL